MLNLDPSKLLVIAVVAIIVLGPERLPRVARQVAGFWRSFSQVRQRMEAEVRGSFPDLPSSTEIATYARSPVRLLDRLASAEPAQETDQASLDQKGELPAIRVYEGRPWATHPPSDPSDPNPPSAPGAREGTDGADQVGFQAAAPLVGDAPSN